MKNTYGFEDDIFMFLGLIIIFFILIAFCFGIVLPFKREREYIKMEMRRSCSEDEYYYWKRKLRKLYLEYLPIIGRFFGD